MRKLFLLLCLARLVWAQNPSCLVEDVGAPLYFRSAAMMAEHYAGNVTGLAALPMSGSAQFGPETIAEVLSLIPSQKVLVVDLRQESHGFLGDHILTWNAEHNWANRGLSHDQVLATERAQLKELAERSEVELLTEEDYDRGQRAGGEVLPVSRVSSEEELVRSTGQDYLRLTVTDHLHPGDEEVERFLQALEQRPQWVHFHCRAGVGRTSTFLAMYDMLQNADKVSLQDILARQKGVRPGWDLNEISTGANRRLSEERHLFLSRFYRYCQARLGGSRLKWSEWAT
ncbi:MAG: hypothetical protein KF760_09430 [Candidatus Eremiobacteraeota bacterium]|nr:hypothetical protein [Candidatus Eremiobacteraeota bacterium]MCW5866250.1 hypothetical protein [Candidatus Eremiobacteraeota bacterium]